MSPERPAKFSRRALLRSSLWGGALVIAAGTGLSLQQTRVKRTPPKLEMLSPEEYAVLEAVADRLCPAQNGFPSASQLEVPLRAEASFALADADEREGFKMALRLVESPVVGALLGERVQPFTRLSPEAQDRVLTAFRDSNLTIRRTIYAGISGLILAHYWGDFRTWPGTQYPGPPNPSGLRQIYRDNLVDLNALRAVKGS